VPRPSFAPTPATSQRREKGPLEHRGEVLTGRIRLDDTSFVDCRFRKAVLVYAGLGATRISGCTFEDTTFEFDGPAANALGFLQAMSHPTSGLRDIVKASFPRIFAH
jgi:hypothetical protein